MIKIFFSFTLSIVVTVTNGQDREKIAKIVEEGSRIYRSEMASWYGTDFFLTKYKAQKDSIGGYFSYGENQITHCVFFSKGEAPKVLARISFDTTFILSHVRSSSEHPEFSDLENEIYAIRKSALHIVTNDSLFKTYKNTNLNLVPIINGQEKKVYILTGPTVDGVVIIGNVYLLSFDQENTLISAKQLHRNIIPINFGNDEEGKKAVATIHSHLPETGDYITPTDIATLMLYGKMTDWEQHYVIADKFVSIWDCKKHQLQVITKKAWDKKFKN